MGYGVPFDAQAKARFVAVLKKRHGRQSAAAEVGVTWATVKKHLKEDMAFLNAVEEAEGLRIEAIETTLYDMALDENLGAIKEVLHNEAGHKWRDQQVLRHEHSGVGGGPIQIAQATTHALVAILTDGSVRANALELASGMPTAMELEAEIEDRIIDVEPTDDVPDR